MILYLAVSALSVAVVVAVLARRDRRRTEIKDHSSRALLTELDRQR